jgi:hypothetical protein
MGGRSGGGGRGGREGGGGGKPGGRPIIITGPTTSASAHASFEAAANLHGELINKGASPEAIKAALTEKKAMRTLYNELKKAGK